MKSINYFFFGLIAGSIILLLAYLLILYGRIKTIRDFKKLVGENNICNESSIFFMLDRMSFKEMDLLSEEIKTFLKNNFIINLTSYREGSKLIDVRIEVPEKKEKLINMLDQLIYRNTKIPFLTKTGLTMATQFKAAEMVAELDFLNIPGLKKELYIN